MAGFEFDPTKSRSNKDKHGVDFVEAQTLWEGPIRQDVGTPHNEDRFVVTGKIGEKHWAAVVTYRDDVIRIISVRRARADEIRRYEQQIGS